MKKTLITHFFTLCIICFSPMFIISCGGNDEPEEQEVPEVPITPEKPEEPEEPEPLSSEKEITVFSFLPSANKGLTKPMRGVFAQDSAAITIRTQVWIENIKTLIPTFSAVGKVTVNGEEQISGVSMQDFTKEVIYTVTAEDHSMREYRISFESPQQTGLPVIKIDTENRQGITSKENYINADIRVIDPNNENYCLTTTTGIRGRGNSTWVKPKKPYRLKFHEKTSLFGLAKEKSWVLLANYQDPTLIMNTVAFELGQRFNLPFTNHYNHVELYLNEVYQGSYMLTEQVQVKKSRVNVDEKEGFLVELDQYYDEDPKFRTNILGLPVIIKSPDLDDNPGVNTSFVNACIQELETAMFGQSSGFPNNNYKDLIDIDNVIDFIMINELVRNVEVKHPKSIYMYKDKGKKIGFGPLWDFDWAFGYGDDLLEYFHTSKAGTMLMHPGYTWDGNTGHKFFCRFFDDPEFRKRYKARWNELYPTHIATMDDFIEKMANQLKKSQQEDGTAWTPIDYREQIDRMKRFWNERIKLLNTQINNFEY